MKRAAFRFLCILLLLAGQQAALTHALSHAQHRLARTALVHDTGEAGRAQGKAKTERFALCDFDYAYSQVLGAIHSACVPPLELDGAFGGYAARFGSRAGLTEVPFLIRGPPAFV